MLGLYPANSTQRERKAIAERATQQYNAIMSEWRQVETTKKEIEVEAVNGHRVGSIYSRSREGSPTLSVLSSTPDLSPERNTPEALEDLASSSDTAVNGLSCDGSRDQPLATLDDHTTGDEELPPMHNGVCQSCDEGEESCDQPTPTRGDAEDTANRARRSDSPLPPSPEELVMLSMKLSSQGKLFAKELFNIDKDIPRCDRDYW